jgi:mono/diheme cytochrome c family protein
MKSKTTLTLLGITLAIALSGSAAFAADAAQSFEKNCVKCHGKDGKGNTKMGRQSGVKDYTDPKIQEEMKDDKALKTIKEGITEKGKEKMKAYGGELNDEEIKALIALMRAFKK